MTQQAPHVPDAAHFVEPLIASETATPKPRWSLLARLRLEDRGQDVIEYALAAALVGLTSVSSMSGLATDISNSFDGIATAVASAVPADSTTNSGGGNNNNNGGGRGRGGGRGGRGGGFGGFGGGFGGFGHHH